MSSRYERLKELKNSADLYQKTFVDRNVKFVNQYETQTFNYPTGLQLRQLQFVEHAWAQHDKFWRLSEKYYGDPNYWWVISFYNQKPTDHEVSIGEIILIPTPLEKILFYIEG
jgi:hypothetical protein